MAGTRINAVPKVTRSAVKDLDDSQRSAGKNREATQRKRSRQEARKKLLMVEAMDIASTYDITISKNNNIVEVLQLLLDRLMDQWRVVCKEVDGLERQDWLVEKVDEQGNTLVEPNIWLQYESTLRVELTDLALRMGHLGVDERRVRVQEAQIELLGYAVKMAAQKANLDPEQTKNLGIHLRQELQALEAGPGELAKGQVEPTIKAARDKHQQERMAKYKQKQQAEQDEQDTNTIDGTATEVRV